MLLKRLSVFCLVAIMVGFVAVRVFQYQSTSGAEIVNEHRRRSIPHVIPRAGLGQLAPAYVVVGGGSVPESNEVQIEQDVLLAQKVFGLNGWILFAGGPGTNGVQVRAEKVWDDPLMLELSQLFSPRRGRDARYRRTRVSAAYSATKENVIRELSRALSMKRAAPLKVLFLGHGDKAESRRENVALLWGHGTLSVTEYAELLETSPSVASVTVATGCFSGGFAELIFRNGDVSQGTASGPRCGLFSTTWDLEAAGCDPDPDRRQQEGYGLHFFNALRGNDREGKTLPNADVDLDQDGSISFLEAHSRVRIASLAADVPTTTSERWLRYIGPQTPQEAAVALPEEDAVIHQLSQRLGLPIPDSKDIAAAQFAALQSEIDNQNTSSKQLKKTLDTAYRVVLGEVLSRWPILDDPWHPDFQDLVDSQRDAIATWLTDSPNYAAYLQALGTLENLEARLMQLRLKSAPYERLLRAFETRTLARRLRARGGKEWVIYERLLSCERAHL